MIRPLQHSALIICFGVITVANRVDWGWRVASPPGPPPQPTVIVLSPPMLRDGGFLRKVPESHTTSSHPITLYRFPITWYTNAQGWPPGNDITASGKNTRYGVVACPIAFPFGTRFVILMPWGYKEFICEDRFRDPAWWGLDIWLPSTDEGYKWHGEHWALVVFDNRPLKEYNISVEE